MTNKGQTRMDRHKQKNKEKTSKGKFTWKKLLLYLGIAFLALGISIGGLFLYFIVTAPDLDIEKLEDTFSSRVYDMDGNFITDLGSEQRTKISYDDLPEVLVDAVLATEDVRFFSHIGIDFRRIGGAILANLKRGFGAEGASTITQQVVENSFFTADKKLKRKVQEQWLSLKLEREYSKEEILEIYLNKIFYGSGAYGVAKASEIYFGKTDLHDLTLVEAAILAGLPQRPSAYNPYENPDLMQGRLNTVLKLMVRHEKITEEEAEEARNTDISSLLVGKKPKTTPYEAFIQQVKKELNEKLEDVDLYSAGLKIYTTLDPKAQEYVEFLLTDSDQNPINFVNEDLQAALTVLDTETGKILAIGGGRNRENLDEFNFAIQGKRQPGSTFKPLLVHGPAIEFGKISTYHQINDDKPYEVAGTAPIRNIDRKYRGWVSARTSLSSSINVPTVKLFEEIGAEDRYAKSKEFAERLGIEFAQDPINIREAIGGHETNVTPLQLAGAYRPFGNGGIYNEPYSVTKIEYPDGKVLELAPKAEAVMADYTAYMITDILKDVLSHGTGRIHANIPNLAVAGKTGTTNLDDELGGGANNKWFVGYTTNYTISAWVGYEKSNKALIDGQFSLAEILFKHAMTEMSKDVETKDFIKPNSVVELAIEKGTNPPKLPSKYTPSNHVITELFVKGHEPSDVSEQYDQLDPVKNLKASFDHDEEKINVSWDYDEEASFQISASINEASKKLLSTTEENTFDITKVEMGATYEIEVIAIDPKDSAKKSEPKSTIIKLPEVQDDENNEDDLALDPVTNLQATYNEQANNIIVTWSYSGQENRFKVKVNNDEYFTSNKEYVISNVQADTRYKITVSPLSKDDLVGPEKSTELYISPSDDDQNNNDADNNSNNDENNNSNNAG